MRDIIDKVRRGEQTMKIGVISDTHDHKANTQKMLDEFRRQNINTIIHAGDLISPFMLNLFNDFKVYAVKGNNDGDIFRIMQNKQETFFFDDELMSLKIKEKNVCVYHGTNSEIHKALVESQNYDVVISGHTHKVQGEKKGKTLVLNPGSLHGFEKQGTAMVLDIDTLKVKLLKV